MINTTIAAFLSIVSFICSIICVFAVLGKNKRIPDHEWQPLGYSMGNLLIVIVVVITSLAVFALLLKGSDGTSVDQLISMQGITLAITGAAVSVISILSTLQRYDQEKKGKEIESKIYEKSNRLNAEFAEKKHIIDDGIIRMEKQIILLRYGLYGQFMDELQKANGSVAGRYFFDQFYSIKNSTLQMELLSKHLPLLATIEMNLNKTIEYYNQNRKDQISRICSLTMRQMPNEMIVENSVDKLVKHYIETRKADFLFYAKGDMDTVNIYYQLLEACKGQEPEVDKMVVYYANCVLFLLTIQNKTDDKRIAECIEIFDNDAYEMYMIPTYYRNLGVYLERIGKIEDAKEKYTIAISCIDREPKEYKSFVTYVSATIKIYKSLYPNFEFDDSIKREIEKCHSYLEYAIIHMPSFAYSYTQYIMLAGFYYILLYRESNKAISTIELNVSKYYALKEIFKSQEKQFEDAKRFYDMAFDYIKQYERSMN